MVYSNTQQWDKHPARRLFKSRVGVCSWTAVKLVTFLPASLLCKFISALLEETPWLRSGVSTKAWDNAMPYDKLSEQPDHWNPVELGKNEKEIHE